MAQAKYTPTGGNLNPAIAVIQAANALDIAARIAIDCKDSETLVRIAREWVEISGRLGYGDEDDEEEDGTEESDRRSFGFSVVSDIGNDEEEEDDTECPS